MGQERYTGTIKGEMIMDDYINRRKYHDELTHGLCNCFYEFKQRLEGGDSIFDKNTPPPIAVPDAVKLYHTDHIFNSFVRTVVARIIHLSDEYYKETP